MDEKKTNQFAWGVVWVIVFIILAIVFLFGWGFVELIQWITSK